MKKLLKSTGAIILGFIVGAALSIGMDTILIKSGFMVDAPFCVDWRYFIPEKEALILVDSNISQLRTDDHFLHHAPA